MWKSFTNAADVARGRRVGLVFLLAVGITPAWAQQAVPAGKTLEQRVGRLERIMENQVQLYLQVEALQRQADELRGQQEVLQHRLERLDKSQKDLYLDIDNRLRQLEAAMEKLLASSGGAASSQVQATSPVDDASVAGTPAPTPAGPGEIGGAPIDVPENVAVDRQDYESAFALLKDGHYDRAIAAFQDYLLRHPQGRYAANAQYWLGEAFYVKRDFERAIQEFSQVLARFPESHKVPDAMLKLGFSHYELKRYDRARQILEQLVRQYPDSTAARLAQRRLQQMKLERRG